MSRSKDQKGNKGNNKPENAAMTKATTKAKWAPPNLSLQSVSFLPSSNTEFPIGDERANIVLQRDAWNRDIAAFEKKVNKEMNALRSKTMKEMKHLRACLISILMFTTPHLSQAHHDLVIEYMEFLFSLREPPEVEFALPHGLTLPKTNSKQGSAKNGNPTASSTPINHTSFDAKFKHLHLLENWGAICHGTFRENTNRKVEEILKKMRNAIVSRDEGLKKLSTHLRETLILLLIKRDGNLAWTKETNLGRKDRFYTLHQMAKFNMIDLLARTLQSSVPKKKKLHEFNEDEQETKELGNGDNTNGTDKRSGRVVWDVDERDPDFGLTPLVYAVKAGNTEAVNLLLSWGADPFVRVPPDNRTPLHYAAAYGNSEIIVSLLEHGVSEYAKDNFGCQPIDLARQNQNHKAIATLERWSNLLPPLPPPPQKDAEDLSEIPDFYHKTKPERLALMSPTLRLLTKRLEGDDADNSSSHSLGRISDPYIEIRLCDKHSRLALSEGMVYEGLKSMRRKFHRAKELVLSELERCQEENAGAVSSLLNNAKKMSAQSALAIGRELAELLIDYRCDGFAVNILCECADIPNLDSTSLVSLFARTSEVGLCVHDHLLHFLHKKESKAITTLPDNPNLYLRTRYPPPSRELLEITTFQNNSGGRNQDSHQSVPSQTLPQTLPLSFNPKEATTFPDHASATSNVATTMAKDAPKSSPEMTFHSLPSLLQTCRASIVKALELHNGMYSREVMEQVTKAPLLELLSEVCEREGRLEEAHSNMQHAYFVCCRCLSPHSQESIRLGLQTLRLHMLYALRSYTPMGFLDAAKLADALSHDMDEMGRENLRIIQNQQFLEKMKHKKRPASPLSSTQEQVHGVDGTADKSADAPTSSKSIASQTMYQNLYSQAAELLSLCKLLYEQEMDRPGDDSETILVKSKGGGSSDGGIPNFEKEKGILSRGPEISVTGFGKVSLVKKWARGKSKKEIKEEEELTLKQQNHISSISERERLRKLSGEDDLGSIASDYEKESERIHRTSSSAARVLATPTVQSRPILKAFKFFRGDFDINDTSIDAPNTEDNGNNRGKSAGLANARGGMYERFASIAMTHVSGGIYTNIVILNEQEESLKERKGSLDGNELKSNTAQSPPQKFKSYIFEGEFENSVKSEEIKEEKLIWWV